MINSSQENYLIAAAMKVTGLMPAIY